MNIMRLCQNELHPKSLLSNFWGAVHNFGTTALDVIMEDIMGWPVTVG